MDLYIEGHNVNTLEDIQYIMIKIQANVWGTKFKFFIDIGHDAKSESRITNYKGEAINFQSEIDVMNYLFMTGWVHKQSIVAHNPSTGAKVNKILFVRKTFHN